MGKCVSNKISPNNKGLRSDSCIAYLYAYDHLYAFETIFRAIQSTGIKYILINERAILFIGSLQYLIQFKYYKDNISHKTSSQDNKF